MWICPWGTRIPLNKHREKICWPCSFAGIVCVLGVMWSNYKAESGWVQRCVPVSVCEQWIKVSLKTLSLQILGIKFLRTLPILCIHFSCSQEKELMRRVDEKEREWGMGLMELLWEGKGTCSDKTSEGSPGSLPLLALLIFQCNKTFLKHFNGWWIWWKFFSRAGSPSSAWFSEGEPWQSQSLKDCLKLLSSALPLWLGNPLQFPTMDVYCWPVDWLDKSQPPLTKAFCLSCKMKLLFSYGCVNKGIKWDKEEYFQQRFGKHWRKLLKIQMFAARMTGGLTVLRVLKYFQQPVYFFGYTCQKHLTMSYEELWRKWKILNLRSRHAQVALPITHSRRTWRATKKAPYLASFWHKPPSRVPGMPWELEGLFQGRARWRRACPRSYPALGKSFHALSLVQS